MLPTIKMYLSYMYMYMYLLVFSSPCQPALRGEGSGNFSGGPLASPGGMSHSPAGVEYSGAHFDWQALVKKITKYLHTYMYIILPILAMLYGNHCNKKKTTIILRYQGSWLGE